MKLGQAQPATTLTAQRRVLDLNGAYDLCATEHDEHAALLPFQDCNEDLIVEASVPGDVNLDLFRAGKIENPYYDINYRQCREFAEKDWWYRKKFTVEPDSIQERVHLVLDGLDTIATIWLNGTLLAKVENMHRIWRFDVSSVIAPGENTLVVKFDSSLKIARKRARGDENVYGEKGRVYLRKAQMSFGWDNVPEIATIGIYRDVYLESFPASRIEDVWVRTLDIAEDRADLRITSRIDSTCHEELSLHYQVSFNNEPVMAFERAIQENEDVSDVTIPSPALWWPHTLGTPNLYALTVVLKRDGVTIDSKEIWFGIRTIEVIEEDQPDDATSFIFSINGTRHFVYGANWQPLDAFTSQVGQNQYEAVLTMTQKCGFNMLRVWGGGIVEKEDFYVLCDRLGIMVWQDFFFACAVYPTDDAFLKTIAQEEEEIIVRLRNHPSIALWCGDNEIDFLFYYLDPENYKSLNRISYEVTGELLERLDGGHRFYLPSSPSSKHGLPDDRKSRNYHNWDCWHHKKSHKSFATEEARFLSEFGRYAAPRFDSLRKFVPEEKQWPVDNETYSAHCGQLSTSPDNPDYVNNFAAQLKEFGQPSNIREFVHLTQVSQAEFYKFAYEHFRSRKYLCGGGIMWKLADTWPCLENSVIDYWGHPKPGLYFLKRVFSPILVFFRDSGETVSVWLSNDTQLPVSAKIELNYIDFQGNTLWARTLDCAIEGDSARAVHDIPVASLPTKDRSAEALIVQAFDSDHNEISRNVYFLNDLNEMRFPKANVAIVYNDSQATVSTDAYARWVELENGPYELWEDNYFDLLPNETRVVNRVLNSSEVSASWKLL